MYEALVTKLEDQCTHVQPLSFKASMDPDTLYLHEALQQPDHDCFIEAMEEEIQAYEKGKHWKIVPHDSVPKENPFYQVFGQCLENAKSIHKRYRW